MIPVFMLFACFGFGFSCLLMAAVFQIRLKTFEAAVSRLSPSGASRRPLRVVLLHPDLGLGGAERLTLDAALALQRQRVAPVRVGVCTSRHDPSRAFPETLDGTVPVTVAGAWIPASVFGRAKVLCATLRMLCAAAAAVRANPDVDAFLVDQVAAALPLLHLLAPFVPKLFYCHFPDQRCDANRDEQGRLVRPARGLGVAHGVYRKWFDSVEEWAMGFADSVVSNSKFSREVTVQTFPRLQSVIDPEKDIFYPPVSWTAESGTKASPPSSDKRKEGAETENRDAEWTALQTRLMGRSVVLSINRYERKKNLTLAVEAIAQMLNGNSDPLPHPLLLIVAGGYDDQLRENVEYLQELQKLALHHKLTEDHAIFLKNISNSTKALLLSQCCCLVYTPTMEHFGIVPTEAMVCGKPVVAVNQGGPCESVGEGGTLCDPTPEAFAQAILAYAQDEALAQRVGAAGRKRALELFSMDVFGEKLATRILDLWLAANAKIAANYTQEDTKRN